jgi:NAD(P)-dependent dehydrogenase (short-subunit alcohol dehydrogenase family)
VPQLSGKVCVVTGANQGIGKGIARAFAAEGASLALCARNADKLAETTRELAAAGAQVFAHAADVSREADVEKFFDALLAHYGKVDILVNNAGSATSSPFEKTTMAEWEQVVGACLTGAFLCSRRAFAVMKEQGKGGRILNIGSISAQRPREGSIPYASAKFGVWGLTQAVALEGRPHGIVCSCLHPGNVAVERRRDNPLDTEPMMSVETIAKVALSMVTLPPDVNLLEAICLPVDQTYLGRG